MQKGVKFRIYPNREEQNLINQTLGCSRLVYNRGLAMREEAYKNGNKIGYSSTSAMLTDLKRKENFVFLKVVDSEQRKLSRKQKGSNNRNKQRVKAALVHEKITNQRKDFLQKQSSMLIRENQTICTEDLKVKHRMRNHKLAKHIGPASWSKFLAILTYKAAWYGNDIVKIPTMYPSSQTCLCCGYKNPLVKNLAVSIKIQNCTVGHRETV